MDSQGILSASSIQNTSDVPSTPTTPSTPSTPSIPSTASTQNAPSIPSYSKRPEFTNTPCNREVLPGTGWSQCTWERLTPMKAKWALSLASADHYPAAKAFFKELGIETVGYIQWRDPPRPAVTKWSPTRVEFV